MESSRIPRVVLHLDMDAFYAAVEIRENPALAGKPLIIGHRGRRGVVATCSYEARPFGVRSAMPSVTAERLCPRAIWLPGRMELYVEVSRRIHSILRDAAPLVEPVSIDEAFLKLLTGLALDLESGRRTAVLLKQRIREEERLSASVGVAPNKFLAKLASDLEKPDGLVVFLAEDVPVRLWPLPVRRLWGVGPKTGERLEASGLHTVGDVAGAGAERLRALVGVEGAAHLDALSRGEDERPVVAERVAKSISEERTYGEDLVDPEEIDGAFLARAEGVARELRREGLVARTVQIKVRTGDYRTTTRAVTLVTPTDLAEQIVEAARRLYRERVRLERRGVRLLGVSVSGLEASGQGQARLFSAPGEQRARRAARAADAVRDRWGEQALTRARLLRSRGGKVRASKEKSGLPSVD